MSKNLGTRMRRFFFTLRKLSEVSGAPVSEDVGELPSLHCFHRGNHDWLVLKFAYGPDEILSKAVSEDRILQDPVNYATEIFQEIQRLRKVNYG